MSNELMKKGSAQVQQRKVGIAGYLSTDAVKQNIENVVGKNNVTRFVSSVVSAVQTNPALSECTNNSILSAALLGEALQLTPSPVTPHVGVWIEIVSAPRLVVRLPVTPLVGVWIEIHDIPRPAPPDADTAARLSTT